MRDFMCPGLEIRMQHVENNCNKSGKHQRSVFKRSVFKFDCRKTAENWQSLFSIEKRMWNRHIFVSHISQLWRGFLKNRKISINFSQRFQRFCILPPHLQTTTNKFGFERVFVRRNLIFDSGPSTISPRVGWRWCRISEKNKNVRNNHLHFILLEPRVLWETMGPSY